MSTFTPATGHISPRKWKPLSLAIAYSFQSALVPDLPGEFVQTLHRVIQYRAQMRVVMALRGLDMSDHELVGERYGWLMNTSDATTAPA
ncbi:hypothetical protein CYR55_22610 [Chimaeribacter californicus]|uniref:Uncharacterized protein n=1 Tax=Chimaeribacter californicus TaxID=2060067 RepID=A0A2N5DTH8_9GAMM|nr:hypothetical protein [Chimaeribacter californicus]PLR29812.1 hypothetical protein CYR55_22610 [Chimaeribacter californicus]